MKLLLILLLMSAQSFSQTTTATLPAVSAPSVAAPATNTSQGSVSTSMWQRVKAKFKINYFSETLGPTIKKWDDNEYADDGSKLDQPMTMYHSFNVRYLLTERFNLFMSPRFSTVIGDRRDLPATQEQHNVYLDDWQFGIFYTIVKTPTFQYNNRLTHRHPFSVRSHENEKIDSQIEWQHDLTFSVSPAFRIIHWNNYRFYKYNAESSEERYRINFTTLFNYTINDYFNVQYMNEFDLQHRNRNANPDHPKYRDMNYMKRNKLYNSFGIGFSPVRDLTFIPFIRLMDERNIRNETTMVGLWVLGKVI